MKGRKREGKEKERRKERERALTCSPGSWFRGTGKAVEIHLDKESRGNDPYRPTGRTIGTEIS